jgi:hypothetical protein
VGNFNKVNSWFDVIPGQPANKIGKKYKTTRQESQKNRPLGWQIGSNHFRQLSNPFMNPVFVNKHMVGEHQYTIA